MAGYGALLGKAWDLGKKAYQVVTETFGNPNTPFDVVEIPNSQLTSSFHAEIIVGTAGQLFKVFAQNSGQMFHVVCSFPGSTASQR